MGGCRDHVGSGGEAIADIGTCGSRPACSACRVAADGVADFGRGDPGGVGAGGEGAVQGAPPRVEPAARVPTSKVAGMDLGETIVLVVDATLITAHSEKEQAAATFKHGFGLHPIGVLVRQHPRAARDHAAARERRLGATRGRTR